METFVRFLLILTCISISKFDGFAQLSVLGSQTQSNTFTENDQQFPQVAMDATGDYVMVWESWGADGDGYGIYARLYNVDGTPKGSSFLVNTITANDQRFPAVAMDEDGDFVVVWQHYNGSDWEIYYRTFDPTGTGLVVNMANTTSVGRQAMPKVEMSFAGEFGIVWEDESDITLRLFDSSGSATIAEETVNSTTSNAQNYPDIAMDSGGDFVVVWASYDTGGNSFEILGQRYDGTGVKQGTELSIASGAGDQDTPAVAMDEDGDFVVVWTDDSMDGDNDGIFGQRFNADGVSQGASFQVNTTTSSSQDNAAVEMNLDGFFVIAWNSYAQDGSFSGVYQCSFAPDGTPVDSEQQVNTTTSLFQQFPSVALWDIGNALIVWQDGLEGSGATLDGDGFGIVSQRYSASALPIELLDFWAFRRGASVQLEWATATEINADHFEVEHSTDGIHFRKIGLVKAVGNTTEKQAYNLVHLQPIIGINYYRLKLVDFDGSFDFSPIKTVEFKGSAERQIIVYPNPTASFLQILLLEEGNYSFAIYASNGQQVMGGELTTRLDVSALAEGEYILKVMENESPVYEVKKFAVIR